MRSAAGYSQALRANNDLSGRVASRTFLAANPAQSGGSSRAVNSPREHAFMPVRPCARATRFV